MDSSEIHDLFSCLESFSALPPNSALLMDVKFSLTLVGKSVTPSGDHSH